MLCSSLLRNKCYVCPGRLHVLFLASYCSNTSCSHTYCMLCAPPLLHTAAFYFSPLPLLAVAYCVHCTLLVLHHSLLQCCSRKFAFRSKMKDAIGVHDLTLSRGSSTSPGLLSKSAAGSRRISKHTPSLIDLPCLHSCCLFSSSCRHPVHFI